MTVIRTTAKKQCVQGKANSGSRSCLLAPFATETERTPASYFCHLHELSLNLVSLACHMFPRHLCVNHHHRNTDRSGCYQKYFLLQQESAMPACLFYSRHVSPLFFFFKNSLLLILPQFSILAG